MFEEKANFHHKFLDKLVKECKIREKTEFLKINQRTYLMKVGPLSWLLLPTSLSAMFVDRFYGLPTRTLSVITPSLVHFTTQI